MTSQEKAINLRYLFLTYKPGKKKKKHINTFTSFFWLYWYVSIFSEKYFWPQYMYHKMSPNNGFRWFPLGKLSHLGLEKLRCAYVACISDAATSDGDACPIEIFFLRSDLTHNYGVVNFSSSILKDIFKYNDAEGVCAFHSLVLGAFLSFANSLA